MFGVLLMSYISLNEILDAIDNLDLQQKQLLLRFLQDELSHGRNPFQSQLSTLSEIREVRFHEGLTCPYCDDSNHIKRNGTYRGRQRYLHKTCGRTFNDLTRTPIHRTRYLDKWPQYLQAMLQGKTIRECAEEVEISVPTAFYWRHKILHALAQDKPKKLSGIVEADETYVLYSEKGNRHLKRKARRRGGVAKTRGLSREQVSILVARDRNKSTVAQVATFGRLNASIVDQLLGPHLQEGVTICTDADAAFRKFASIRNLNHMTIHPDKKRYVVKAVYHIQNVNAYHERFKNFMRPFRGVATKYLSHYVSYHQVVDETKHLAGKEGIKELFHRSLRCPMKTIGKKLPHYCALQINQLAS